MVVIDEHDVGKTKKEVLMDLIYEATERRIPLDKVTFGKPQEVDVRKDLIYDPNTFIPMRVDPGYDNRYNTPETGVLYRRRSLKDHLKDVDFSMVLVEKFPVRVSELLEQVNYQLKYPIAACEIQEFQYDTSEQLEKFGLYIMADPESVLWFDGGPMMGVDVGGKPGLVTITRLMGFFKYGEEPPEPTLIEQTEPS